MKEDINLLPPKISKERTLRLRISYWRRKMRWLNILMLCLVILLGIFYLYFF